MATKMVFVGDKVSELRYSVVQRTCKTYGKLTDAGRAVWKSLPHTLVRGFRE